MVSASMIVYIVDPSDPLSWVSGPRVILEIPVPTAVKVTLASVPGPDVTGIGLG